MIIVSMHSFIRQCVECELAFEQYRYHAASSHMWVARSVRLPEIWNALWGAWTSSAVPSPKLRSAVGETSLMRQLEIRSARCCCVMYDTSVWTCYDVIIVAGQGLGHTSSVAERIWGGSQHTPCSCSSCVCCAPNERATNRLEYTEFL